MKMNKNIVKRRIFMWNIRKALTSILACAVALTAIYIPASALSGDVNGDDVLDINDATAIQLHLSKTAVLTDESLIAADINGDEIIDINDVSYIQRMLAGYRDDESETNSKPDVNATAEPKPSITSEPDTKPETPAESEPIKSTQPATEPVTGFDGTMQGQIFRLVNQERAKAGASPLVYDVKLAGYAQIRVNEIVENFSHTRPGGAKCFTVIPESDPYYEFGENIAYGYDSAEMLMDDWMASESQRANILKASYTNIGIGYITVGERPYYVQLFGAIESK